MKEESMSEDLTMVEAAKIADVAERTIRRAVKSGKLPADLTNPKKAKIARADLERWKGNIAIPQHDDDRAQLIRRIEDLERRVAQLEHLLRKQHRQKIKPVALLNFATLHNVGSTDYQRAINMQVLPVQRRGDTLLLDGAGQQAFWQIFHELPAYVSCGDCPH
jgi:hypothetical protein